MATFNGIPVEDEKAVEAGVDTSARPVFAGAEAEVPMFSGIDEETYQEREKAKAREFITQLPPIVPAEKPQGEFAAGPSTPMQQIQEPMRTPVGQQVSATAGAPAFPGIKEEPQPIGTPQKAHQVTVAEAIEAVPQTAAGKIQQASAGLAESAVALQQVLPGKYAVAAINSLASLLAGEGTSGWEDTLQRFSASDKRILERQGQMYEAGEQRMREALPEGEMGLFARSVLSAGSSLSTALPLMAAGLLTRNPNIVAPAFGVIEYAKGHADSFAQDGNYLKATSHGLVSGLAEWGTSALPVKWLFANDVGFKKRLVNFALAEIPGENVAELTQKVSRYIHDLPEDMSAEAFLNTMAETTLSTLMAGGVQMGTMVGVEKAVDAVVQQRNKKIIEKFGKDESMQLLQSLLLTDMDYKSAEKLIKEINERPDVDIGPHFFGVNIQKGENAADFDLFSNKAVASFPRDKMFSPLDLKATPAQSERLLRAQTDAISGLPFSDPRVERKPGEVKVAEFSQARKQVDMYDERIVGIKDAIAAATDPADKEAMIRLLKETTQARRVATELLDHDTDIMTNIASIMQEWVKTYMPAGKLILYPLEMEGATTRGHHYVLDDGTLIVGLNRDAFVDSASSKRLNRPALVEVAGHEFGHALVSHYWEKLPDTTKNAIYKEYKDWLLNARKVTTLDELWRHRDTPALVQGEARFGGRSKAILDTPTRRGGKRAEGPYQAVVSNLIRQQMNTPEGKRELSFQEYIYSFDEYMANNIAKALTKSKKGLSPVEVHYARTAELLKRFWQRFGNTWAPKQSVEAWLEMLALDKQIDNTIQLLEAKGVEVQREDLNKPEVIMSRVLDKLDLPVGLKKEVRSGLDKYGRVMKYGYTLLQLAEANPTNSGLQQYVRAVKEWANLKSSWNFITNEVLNDWNGLGKDQAERLSKYLLATAKESIKKQRALTPSELSEINNWKAHQLSDDALTVFDSVQGMFKDALGFDMQSPGGIYKVLLDNIKKEFKDAPTAAMAQIEELNKEMQTLANRTYFPFSRFGKFTVMVRALEGVTIDGTAYKTGEVIDFRTVETQKEQKQLHRELTRNYPKHRVSARKMSDEAFSFRGLPPQIIQRLRSKMDLSPEQQEVLDGIIFESHPGRTFLSHLQKRQGTPGFSEDAMRVFADYFQHYAGHLARASYYDQLNGGIQAVRTRAADIAAKGGNATTTDLIAEHLENHYDYIMNPGNEWANLRAFGFLVHLGFNMKSAYVNFFQTPVMTYSYLAARKELGGGIGIGDLRAVKEISLAAADIPQVILGKKDLTSGEQAMIDQLRANGIIDESLATEVAAAAEGGILSRYLPGTFLKSKNLAFTVRRVSSMAAVPFQLIEQYNRRITALATYRLAIKAGMDQETATQEAHTAIEKTQFEYARWNRPRLFRGKQSFIFLFYSHLQNSLHFFRHDPGGARALLMTVFLAGLSGLPGAEDIMDLFDLLANWYNKHFGTKDVKTDIRQDIRKFSVDLGMNPDLIMHGTSRHYGLGLLHALELTGLPVPNVDISGSLSYGRVVPGLQPLLNPRRDSMSTLGRAGEDVLGASVTPFFGLYDMIAGDNPDTWKASEKMMFTFMANLSKSARWAVRGEETDRTGARIVEFDVTDPRHLAEIAANAVGFAPTRLRMAQEGNWQKAETLEYYLTRREMILRAFNLAKKARDPEAVADAKDAVRRFNRSVPDRTLRITGENLADSYMSYRKGIKMVERGFPRQPKYRGIYRDLADIYPQYEFSEEEED
jgi:hypothetical protein